MEVSVAVYEKRGSVLTSWRTLGLGELTCERQARNPAKLRQHLIDDLRETLRKTDPWDLGDLLEFPTGIKLHRVRLELRLRRIRYSGMFPLVVAPRRLPGRAPILVAYHPETQNDWFPWDRDVDLVEQATAFFRDRWRDTPEERLHSLRVPKKGIKLRVLNFNAAAKKLSDTVKKSDERELLNTGRRSKKKGPLRVLPEVGLDLSSRAADRVLSIGRPRSPYRERLQELLGGVDKSSAVLVGAPGVGKTTLAKHFVQDLLEGDGYRVHSNLDRCQRVWQISGRRLIAGMSLFGQWEEQAIDLLEEVRPRRIILFVEDLHAFGQLGRTVSSERSLADVFRGPVARREVCILGELTPEKLQTLENDAPAFAALLTAVPVNATSRDETLGMLLHESRRLEQKHDIVIEPDTLRVLIETTETLFTTAALPGKALDLLNVLARRSERGTHLKASDLLVLISERTGVPQILLRPELKLTAADVEHQLRRSVLGQEDGIRAARDVILRIKTGLTAARKPYGTLLFTGPTGTGKTELAKAIAAFLYGAAGNKTGRLIRFDMSEFSAPDAASRLVGDRIQPRGLLTAPLSEQPFAVVLLDEIEKAHPSVLNLLLQVMGDGRLTDAGGTVADFSHAVLIMTSNLGADGRASVGFSGDGESVGPAQSTVLAAVKAYFPPELFNRIDRIVAFRPLNREVARGIARLEIDRLLARRGLVERNVFVSTTEAVVEKVVRDGFHAEQGARSLKRYLDTHLGGLLAEEVAGQEAAEMRSLCVYTTGGDSPKPFALHAESLREATPGEMSATLESLLTASAERLRGELPAARELIGSLLDGETLAELSETMRRHLENYEIGRQGVADRIFNIDTMRGVLAEVAEVLDNEIDAIQHDEAEELEIEHFGTEFIRGWDEEVRQVRLFDRRAFEGSGRRLTRPEILELLSEVHFLRGALKRVDDPSRHAAFVELLRVSRGPGERFAAYESGLFEWLATAYCLDRGELEGLAWTDVDGTVTTCKTFGDDALEGKARHLVLKVTGLSVLDTFLAENGTHIRSSLSRTPEIVQVRVRPAPADESPGSVAEKHEADRIEFTKLLEAGTDTLPINPEKLSPIVRRYDFEPPANDRRVPCEVEDYVLSYAGTHRVRTLAEVVRLLRLLHQTAQD